MYHLDGAYDNGLPKRENPNFREIEGPAFMTEAVFDPTRDIVGRVAVTGRTSAGVTWKKESTYEFSKKDSTDRGPVGRIANILLTLGEPSIIKIKH
jgi:hypothetical protein